MHPGLARRIRVGALVVLVVGTACGRPRSPAVHETPSDTLAAQAIARDRPQRFVLPLSPTGAGVVAYEAVAPARAELDLPPPAADVSPPPEDSATSETPASSLELKPPIPRGRPVLPRGGSGGKVTLDVRVDERGDVSDLEFVASDADSATVRAATEAARAMHYFPAILGGRHIAVWTRQVFEVARGR